MTRTRTPPGRLRPCARDPRVRRGLRRRRQLRRGSADGPRRDLQQRHRGDQRRSLADRIASSADGDQGGSFEFSLGGPFQGDSEDAAAIPQLDWDGERDRRGRRPVDRLLGRPGGHRRQRLRRVQRQRLRGRDRAVHAARATSSSPRPSSAGATDSGARSRSSARRRSSRPAATPRPAPSSIPPAGSPTRPTRAPRTSTAPRPSTSPADADVDAMLSDIGTLAAAVPGADSQGFDPAQLEQRRGAVTEASIDVYSGADDHVLRKLDVNLTIDPSAVARRAAIAGRGHPDLVRGRDRRPQRGADDRGAGRRAADRRAVRRRSGSTRARSAGSAAPCPAATRHRQRRRRRLPASACSRRPAPRRSTPAPPSSRARRPAQPDSRRAPARRRGPSLSSDLN